jgi:hypothetical protein
LQIVLDRGQRAAWFNSPWVVYATALSAVAFVGLALHELHFSAPFLDLRILKLRIFDAALAVTITFSAVLFGTLLHPIATRVKHSPMNLRVSTPNLAGLPTTIIEIIAAMPRGACTSPACHAL